MIYLRALMVVVALSFSASAYSQSQQDISAWIDDYKKNADELDGIAGNLNSMLKVTSLDRTEIRVLEMSHLSTRHVQAYAMGLLQIASIYSAMRDPMDVSFVKMHFEAACENIKRVIAFNRATFGQLMVLSANGAIRSEVTRSRDVMAMISTKLPC